MGQVSCTAPAKTRTYTINLNDYGNNGGDSREIKWDYLNNKDRKVGDADRLNITTYALGTISSLYEAALKNPGELTKSAVDYNKSMIMATKTASKALFVVGIALTVNDIVENKGSTDSILWGIADTGMSIIGFIPGGQLISGVYFTGRIAYQIYRDVNNN